ncbi:MAG: hypothetical protein ACI33P_14355 [Lysinibacillus sp.]
MQHCHACGYQQPQGNFCGGCGTALMIDPVQAADTFPEAPSHSDSTGQYQPKKRSNSKPAQRNRLQEEIRAYLIYFKEKLNNPTESFTDSIPIKTFATNLLLLVVSALLAIYGLAGDVLGVFVDTRSFLLSMALLYSLFMVVSFIATYLVTYFFAESQGLLGTFKTLSGFYPVAIVLNMASFLLGVVGAGKLALFLFGAAILLVCILIGAFVTVDAVRQCPKSVNGFYAYVVYFLISFVTLSYVLSSIAQSIIDDFIRSLSIW